jgi:hypothetical protein
MRDVADSAADLDKADLAALAGQVDAAIEDLETAGARVVAGEADGVLHVAVLRARHTLRLPGIVSQFQIQSLKRPSPRQ